MRSTQQKSPEWRKRNSVISISGVRFCVLKRVLKAQRRYIGWKACGGGPQCVDFRTRGYMNHTCWSQHVSPCHTFKCRNVKKKKKTLFPLLNTERAVRLPTGLERIHALLTTVGNPHYTQVSQVLRSLFCRLNSGENGLTKQIFRDICFPVNLNWEQSSEILTRKHNNSPAYNKKRSHSSWYLAKKIKIKRGRIRKKATNKK